MPRPSPTKSTPRQTPLLLRNPLIPIWFIVVLATLLAADGGGLLFVFGALMTAVMSMLIARRWVKFIGQTVRRTIAQGKDA